MRDRLRAAAGVAAHVMSLEPIGRAALWRGSDGEGVAAKLRREAAPLFAFAALLSFGCNATGEDITQVPKPATVSFGGKIDPRFAGKWTSSDGNSTIEMLKDGSANMTTVTKSPYGKVVDKVSGQWLVNGEDLLFSYTDKSKNLNVVKYGATLSGASLTLAQAGGRIKTKYARG